MTEPPPVFREPLPAADSLRRELSAAWLADEAECVRTLLDGVALSAEHRRRIRDSAIAMVERVRSEAHRPGGIDAFMEEYDLSSHEGIVLMCLAEALLRIPDAETQDRLIEDKLLDGHWDRHLGRSDSPFVNASTWALMITGELIAPEPDADLGGALRRLVARSSRPFVRGAVRQAMRILGHHFVLGRTIEEALDRAEADRRRGYTHSFDMLGEGARTMRDAERYFASYEAAIRAIAPHAKGPAERRPGISVKLSALHPRYVHAQRERVLSELTPRLSALCVAAKQAGIGLSIDAEEADRLDLSLDLFERVARDPALAGWDGPGFVVQAYQKRALRVLDWLVDLARACERRLPVRLVKGAYWDTEIKRAQIAGLPGYPVFTRKASTDVSFLACARRLLEAGEALFPQFASHNAHTLAAVIEMAGGRRDIEVQRLHGMGEALHDQLVSGAATGETPVVSRIYAPVGGHEELLAYLVRRLLENGANTSFVNRIVHRELPVAEVVTDPVETVLAQERIAHPRIPPPPDLYGAGRVNSEGIELADRARLEELRVAMAAAASSDWRARPVIGGVPVEGGTEREVRDPADRSRLVGRVRDTGVEDVAPAIAGSVRAQPSWDGTLAAERSAILRRASELYEAHRGAFLHLMVREAGKSIPAAVADLREAVDFLRYYAAEAERLFGPPTVMPGPTGEENLYSRHGRGVIACISPWNFPSAIFTGQVAAALAAGNAVIAKPAEQTCLVASLAVGLLHEAGVPPDALHLLPGDGQIGAAIVGDARIAGVAFTGSIEAARSIARSLAARDGPIVPLIAETGGQNAMIVDSSALPEQVVDDVVLSAFDSAGQRCSALRVLCIQEDGADRLIEMLAGAIRELRVGDPGYIDTDVGPVIDEEAKARLDAHIERMRRTARLVAAADLRPECAGGVFVAPHLFEIDDIARLEGEVFGPVLHLVRYRSGELDRLVDAINATGYGLTLGIHSRIDATVERVRARARVGNLYANRNQIGAVVGVQPFGGEGLSGTGPKAGGPDYLARFATERVVSVNTAAAGGNAALLALGE